MERTFISKTRQNWRNIANEIEEHLQILWENPELPLLELSTLSQNSRSLFGMDIGMSKRWEDLRDFYNERK